MKCAKLTFQHASLTSIYYKELFTIYMSNFTKPHKVAVLLVNLGTPDSPTVPDVRRYLRQFLSDPRVIEIPQFIWAIILNLFILTTRPKKVAHAYASIWQDDSPIRTILYQTVSALQQRFDDSLQTEVFPFQVNFYACMTYGNPALSDTLEKLSQEHIEHLLILPVYPQYSATTTGAVFDVIAKWGMKQRNLPHISFIKDYFSHPLYIHALADSIQEFQKIHGKPEKLLFSFHGIPQPYEDKGDPYAQRCRQTALQVAKELGLNDDEWLCSFQSRFGKQEWVKPYTDVTLAEWGKQGIKSVQVLSPAFSADCLETLEELSVENRENFLNAGGQKYHYIPALNVNKKHIDLLQNLVLPLIQGWKY